MKMISHPCAIFAGAVVFLAANVQLRAQPAEIPQPVRLTQDTLTAGLSSEIKPLPVLTAMQRVADWQLAHPATNPPTSWLLGAENAGMMALAGISGDAKYREAMRAAGETNGWRPGPLFYDADDYCVGQAYTELYFLYRDNRMIAPLRERFDAILGKTVGRARPRIHESGEPGQKKLVVVRFVLMGRRRGCGFTPRPAISVTWILP